MKRIQILLIALTMSSALLAKEYHIAKSGNDTNKGTLAAPFLTIQAAAEIAQSGDVILVHEGIYREEIVPPRGGESAEKPIVYLAASGENVSIRGSDQIKKWVKKKGDVWMAELDNSFFGDFNPYKEKHTGSWLSYGSEYHLGEVHLNGEAFYEKFSHNDIETLSNTWYTESNGSVTKIWANFGWADPNANLAEINVRECIIFPDIQGLKHIVIDGFEIKHASSNYAPPDRFQKGAIGTRFGYGWIIQNCRISDIRNVGICLGGVEDYYWDNVFYDHKFVSEHAGNSDKKKTKDDFLPDMNTFGHHIIRNNHITRCGQGGVVGCYGAVGSIIENNHISETNYKNETGGAEVAAIKLHFPIDVIIKDNYVKGVANLQHRTKGIWLDWGVQNARITGNTIIVFQAEGLKLEVGHGPTVVDNNIFINTQFVQWSDATLYAHNLFYHCTFVFMDVKEARATPYYEPHSTKEAGRKKCEKTNDKYINNIFIGNGLKGVARSYKECEFDHNVYLDGAEKEEGHDKSSIVDDTETTFNFQTGANPKSIRFNLGEKLFDKSYPFITSDYVGVFSVTGMNMKRPNGTPLDIDKDYFGNPINKDKVLPGPFQTISMGINLIEIDARK